MNGSFQKSGWQGVLMMAMTMNVVACANEAPDREAYRAHALTHPGDAEKGRALFHSPVRTTCLTCHSIDGITHSVGPNLQGISGKFDREGMIRAVLEPSANIAIGYGTTIITTKSGEKIAGRLQAAAPAWVELRKGDNQVSRVTTADIASQETPPFSLMPEGLHAALSVAEFTDLMAYLGSLQVPKASAGSGTIDETPLAKRGVQLEPFFGPGVVFDHPTWMGEIPDHGGKFLVMEQKGLIWRLERTQNQWNRHQVIDLSATVRIGGATGMLSLAFHPQFTKNGRYFIKYQTHVGGLATIIEQRQLTAELADSGQATEILRLRSVTQDHNGGSMDFGPDGYLYIGMGDTGPQRDPNGHGQDMTTLLSKIIRIDIDHPADGKAYGIPQDNPFVAQKGARPEIWALGFREPWRLSFDRETNDLWVGDVGQDRVEEVSIVRKGENLGWNVYEGADPFSEKYRRAGETYTPPVVSYSHRLGVSVTGGYVYRGQVTPALQGWYVFGDFESRRLWVARQRERKLDRLVEIGRAPSRVVSFAQNLAGELALIGFDDGIICRMDFSQTDLTPLVTRTLLDTAETAPIPWKYTETRPLDDWMKPEFSPKGWREAPGGFGSPGTPGAQVRTEWRSRDIWLRREFTLPEPAPGSPPAAQRQLALRMHHDEDAEIYLNGEEVVSPRRWTSGYTRFPLSEKAAALLRPGRNVLAIHCRQNSGGQYIDAGLVEMIEPAEGSR